MDQLKMKWDVTPIEMPAIPAGYKMRPFGEPGDKAEWCRCCIDGKLGVNGVDEMEFDRIMTADNRVDMCNVYFLVADEKNREATKSSCVVGTITYQYGHTPKEAYIHMVGIAPEARGKGLARAMMLYAMHKIYVAGNTHAYLTTDDFRVPAIRAYLATGFEPVIAAGDEEMAKRWEVVKKWGAANAAGATTNN